MSGQYIVLKQWPHGPIVTDQSIHLCDTATEALDLAEELMRLDDAGYWYVPHRLDMVR